MKKILIVGISSFFVGWFLKNYLQINNLKRVIAKEAFYRIETPNKIGIIDIFRNNKKILSLQEDGQNVVSVSLLNEREIIMSSRILFDKKVSLMGLLFTTTVDKDTGEISNYQWIDPSYAGNKDIAGMRRFPKSK